ncbi:bile acid:sodium symporter family protein [Aeoliella sp. SH292]|uniref:bile acid:sodium symporter family protein n=1 Tax=Aeoliella sp. SH292 TaxID=3454464 RepID=UPI003F981EEA
MQAFYDFYREYAQWFYSSQLLLAMFGMGATSTVQQFRDVFRRPGVIAMVLALQFLVLPGLAVAFSWSTRLEPTVAAGLVLMMSLPSGALTNVVTFIGRGNVPLSITSTCASTAICLFATPMVIEIFGAREFPDDFQMPIWETIQSILLLLLLPLVAGMTIGHYWPSARQVLGKVALWGSIIALAGVWVGALGGGQIEVLQYGFRTPAILAIWVLGTFYLTFALMSVLRFNKANAFTLAIECSMRNGNLGLALLIPLFGELTPENTLHQGALYTCLFSGGAMLVVGLITVTRRHVRFTMQRRAGLDQI